MAKIDNLNEMPMSFNGPERPDSGVERKMANRETGFSNNPGVPATGSEPNQTGEEMLASQRFEQVVDKVKQMTGLGNLQGQTMSLLRLMSSTFMNVKRWESQHKAELENLVIQLVKDEFGEVIEDLEFDLELVSLGSIDTSEFNKQEQNPESPEEMTDEEIEDEMHAFDILEKFTDESAKRRIINAIIQGVAMKGHHLLEKPDATEMLTQIAGQIGPELVNQYGMMMAIQEYANWVTPNMEEMVSQGATTNGSESVEFNEESNKWTVHAKGVMLPILLHETLKGVMEVIGMHGLPNDKKMATAVLKKEDVLYKEVFDMFIGPSIWQAFRMSLPPETLEDDEESKKMILYVLMEFFALPVQQFLNVNRKLIKGDNRDILELVQKVKNQFQEETMANDVDVEALERLIDNEFAKLSVENDFKVSTIPGFEEVLNKMDMPNINNNETPKNSDIEFHPSLNEELSKIKRLLR